MYLVDTNVWIERLLDQASSEEVSRFLEHTSSDHFSITDFAFHSIGVIMHRLRQVDGLLLFVQDAFIDGSVKLIHLDPEDTIHITDVIRKYGLDFDDAYQYVAAEKYNLTIVSFDSDFDQTDMGRKTPAEIMQG